MLSFHRVVVVSIVTSSLSGAIGCAEGVDPSRSDGAATSTGAMAGSGGFVGSAGNAGTGLVSLGTGGGSTLGSGGSNPVTSGGGSAGTGGGLGTSGAGGGSAGGATGTGGAPSFDAGPPAIGVLVAQYMVGDNDPKDGNIKPQLNLVNRSTRSIPLAALTIRYFYTIDGSPPATTDYQQLWLDYADITRITNGGTTVKLSFGKLAKPEPGADHYIQVAFQGGDSLAPGASTNQIQVRANWPNYTVNYDETNDYSWNGAIKAFTDWRKVTVYQNGVLVWGTEPDGTTPKVPSDGGADSSAPADASTPPADARPPRDAGRG